MEGYEGWDDEDGAGAVQRSPASLTVAPGGAARKSVIVFDADDKAAMVPGDDGASGVNRTKSRIFPKVEVQSRRQTLAVNPNAEIREPIYKSLRWPFVITALLVLLGGFAMLVIGCLCVHDYYIAIVDVGSSATGTIQFDVCGPAGGGGGIVMIIAGIFALIIAGYQVWRLRQPMLAFAGYKNWA